jgi:hypothetical protein
MATDTEEGEVEEDDDEVEEVEEEEVDDEELDDDESGVDVEGLGMFPHAVNSGKPSERANTTLENRSCSRDCDCMAKPPHPVGSLLAPA